MDSVGEGEGGMIWESGIETCIISYVKRITSQGSMQKPVKSFFFFFSHGLYCLNICNYYSIHKC